jgi:hypothetical protein
MPLQIDVFLLILRLLFIVLLYLFLMQVVIAITRDLRRSKDSTPVPTTLGHLVVIHSGPSAIPPGTSYPLMPRTTIGRGPTNTIQIKDQTVSAEHTHLWYQNGTWYVQDAGSANGTFVNEQPAREPLPAKVGDVIRVGYIRFQIKP